MVSRNSSSRATNYSGENIVRCRVSLVNLYFPGWRLLCGPVERWKNLSVVDQPRTEADFVVSGYGFLSNLVSLILSLIQPKCNFKIALTQNEIVNC